MHRSVIALLLLITSACGGGDTIQGVNCDGNADCKLAGVQGTCQSSGFCAYPDATCEGGLRYSPGAAGMSEQCVGGTAACGGMDQACCNGTVCGADLTCNSAAMCTCGDKGDACCGGTTCGSNLTCGTD